MARITREQRRAIKRIFDRGPVYISGRGCLTYRQFRKMAFLAFGDCVMVPWEGMILGIEPDGYTHS